MSFNFPDIDISSNSYKITFDKETPETFEKETDVLNKIDTILRDQGHLFSNVTPENKVKLYSKVVYLKQRYNKKTNIIIRLFQEIFGNSVKQKVSQIQTKLGFTEKDIIDSLKNNSLYYDSLPPGCQLNPEECTLERLSEILIQSQENPNNLPPEIIKKIFLKIKQKNPKQLEKQDLETLEKKILQTYSQKTKKDEIADLINLLSYEQNNEGSETLKDQDENTLIEWLTFSLITLVRDEDL